MLATGITNVLANVVAVAGLLAAMFYVLTGLAMMAYYRRRILASVRDFVVVGVLPFGAAGFLGWVVFRSLQLAPAGQKWTIVAVFVSGLVAMLVARFGLRSRFFAVRRESDGKP